MSTARAETESVLSTALPATIFNHRVGEFGDQFNRSSFPISHNLAGHPLFGIPRLVQLAGLLWSKGEGRVTFQAGDIPANIRWDEAPQKKISVVEALKNIEKSGSWVLLKGAQEDPAYRTLLESCLSELEDLAGTKLAKAISWMDAYVFIASPHSVTPYHIDHECNFLLQIHGEKDISIFNQDDRSVLTDEEIERYYIGDLSAARLKDDSQSTAKVYHLRPGTGVHLPVRAPHWVKNGPSFSVSLSIHFFLHSEDMKARVYQLNHYLREFNIAPTPPGKSAMRDRLKVGAVGVLTTHGSANNKAELLRRGVKRLDSVAGIGKRVLHRGRHQSS